MVGVSRRRVAYYEGETHHPPTTILPKLAVALGVSADDILNMTPKKPLDSTGQGAITYHSREETGKRAPRVQEVYCEHDVQIIQGDSRRALAKIPAGTIQCCITSPPYWGLRDYGYNGQIGAEIYPTDYITDLVNIFHDVRRTLTDDGTLPCILTWIRSG